MKKAAIVLLILLVMVFVLLTTVTPLKVKFFGVQPSYKFQQGMENTYSLISDLSMETRMENVPREIAKNFPVKEMKAKITQTMENKVDSMDGNLASVSYTGRIDDMTLSVNGMSAGDLIKKGTESKVLVKVAPTGEIIKNDRDAPLPTEQALMISSLTTTMLLRLPDKVIKPGENWKQKLELTLSPGANILNLSGDVDYKFEELQKIDNRYHMIISFKGNLSPAGAGEMPVTVKGNAAFEGKYWFDIEKGRITKAQSRMDIDTNLQMKGLLGEAMKMSPIRISPHSVITTELELKK